MSTSTPTPSRSIPGALLALLVVGSTLAASAAQAQEITVAPRRVVFEGRERSATVALVNKSAQARTYRVELIDKRMTERGGLVDVEAGVEGSARELIRYSPRRVTLAPGGAQTIRLMVRKPAELADGEYRSHLAFIAEAAPDAGLTLEAATAPPRAAGFSSKLIPLYSVSIPIIVRQGELEARVAVEGAILSPAAAAGPATLDVRLHRDGARSVHGDLVVTWVEGGTQAPVGLLRGISVYTPNAEVAYQLPLLTPAGVDLERGALVIALIDRDKGTPLADYRLQLPTPKP